MAQYDELERRRKKRAALEKKKQQEAQRMRRKLITAGAVFLACLVLVIFLAVSSPSWVTAAKRPA